MGMLRKQEGFTLIEIILVLVIVGIMAALAVPRYMDLAADARNKAANAALAEGMSRVNQVAAKQILTSGTTPTAASVNAEVSSMTDAGDFTLSFAAAGSTSVSITASGTADNVKGGTATGTVKLPTT